MIYVQLYRFLGIYNKSSSTPSQLRKRIVRKPSASLYNQGHLVQGLPFQSMSAWKETLHAYD